MTNWAILDMEVFSVIMFGIDKVYHFLFYALAAFLLGSAAVRLSPRARWMERLVGVALGLWFLGLADEYRQFFDPRRDTEFLDAAANLSGIAAGLALPFVYAVCSYGKMKLPSKNYIPVALALWIGFCGLTFLTSKGPSTEFFPNRTEGTSQQVFRASMDDQNYADLRDKYLPQFLFVEKEYKEELTQLVRYAGTSGQWLHHVRLIKQLGDATDAEFYRILNKMKRDVQHRGLSEDILDQVEKEFMQRKRSQRARIIKLAVLES